MFIEFFTMALKAAQPIIIKFCNCPFYNYIMKMLQNSFMTWPQFYFILFFLFNLIAHNAHNKRFSNIFKGIMLCYRYCLPVLRLSMLTATVMMLADWRLTLLEIFWLIRPTWRWSSHRQRYQNSLFHWFPRGFSCDIQSCRCSPLKMNISLSLLG